MDLKSDWKLDVASFESRSRLCCRVCALVAWVNSSLAEFKAAFAADTLAGVTEGDEEMDSNML